MALALLVSVVVCLTTVHSHAVQKQERSSSVCYGDLGCFSTGGAFTSLHRPISFLPASPTSINVQFMLFTRQNPGTGSQQLLRANDFNSLSQSHFLSTRPTKMISHGFLQNGRTDWMAHMRSELLKYGDYNVIQIDWGLGSGPPYTQATANTRVVGAEIAKLIKGLQDHMSAKPEDFHIIGHSLGAHIAGYAGTRTPNLGRISGLDPADPYFQYTDPAVRLDPSDATFVDVMHTDGTSILKLGFGMIQPCGHVDYFPNSGEIQPGCDKDPVTQIRLEGDLYNGGKEFIACNHLRAHKYFIESINAVCPFQGYKCDSYSRFTRGSCMPCSGDGCGVMGFHADRVKPEKGLTHVKYFLETGDTGPFCRYHYQVKVAIGNMGSVSDERGTLYINLVGTNGQLGERAVSDSVLDIQAGHTYGFMMTSTHDLGTLNQISVHWVHASHWYNPLTWRLLRTSTIQINSIEVINGETEARKKICGFNAAVETDVTKVFSQSC